MIAELLTSSATGTGTGTYFDERRMPMEASARARDPQFQNLVVNQTRALLSGNDGGSAVS